MGDLKHRRSFLSLWLKATSLTKYGGRITWDHLQQRMSFLSYHKLPTTVHTLKKNNASLPGTQVLLKTVIPKSAFTWLSHYPVATPTPPAQLSSKSKIQRWKGFINKSFLSGRWELNDCSNVPNLWQICWQTGHLDWAGPAGNSCIWKLFSWQKLRHAPRTDIPPALANSECKWVCNCVRNTCFVLGLSILLI